VLEAYTTQSACVPYEVVDGKSAWLSVISHPAARAVAATDSTDETVECTCQKRPLR